MEKLFRCGDCPCTVTTGRQLSDHKRKEHGAQNVVCPYCVAYNEFRNPSTLKRHLRLAHPLHDEDLFRDTANLYYFAVKSAAYRSITKNVPGPSSATAGRAQALLRKWAATCRCASSSALLSQAEKDWANLSAVSQPLFPGQSELPDDLEDVIALIEQDPHLVRDIPLPPSPTPQPLQNIPLDLPPPSTLPPAAKVREIPTAPRIPPSPALTPQGKLPSLALSTMDLLKTGSWPALCAGRRDWEQGQPIQVALPATSIRWPPTNWGQMSQEQKIAAWQTLAVMLSWLDEPEGRFPNSSPSRLMDDFSFLALPGSGVGPKPQNKKDRALGELRARNHNALKMASAKDPQLEAELVASLQGSRAAGPARRRALLHQVEAAGVPVRPLWKSTIPPPPPPPPKRPKTDTATAADVYSPTRPEMWQGWVVNQGRLDGSQGVTRRHDNLFF